jgi:hypothetical protein
VIGKLMNEEPEEENTPPASVLLLDRDGRGWSSVRDSDQRWVIAYRFRMDFTDASGPFQGSKWTPTPYQYERNSPQEGAGFSSPAAYVFRQY